MHYLIFSCIRGVFALINCETTPCANMAAAMMTWQLITNIHTCGNS